MVMVVRMREVDKAALAKIGEAEVSCLSGVAQGSKYKLKSLKLYYCSFL